MSYVTNVLLKTSLLESIEPLNERLADSQNKWVKSRPFRGVTSPDLPIAWYGGSRGLECELYPAAFNLLIIDDLIEMIRAVDWEYPEQVQLFVQDQESDKLIEVDLWLGGVP